MTDRFSLLHLVKRALGSMRARAVIGPERLDLVALFILLGLPVGLGAASFLLGWSIRDTDGLVSGFSLLSAALLAVVPQLSAWRQRLTDQGAESHPIGQRKLDEATANTLLGVLASIFLAVLCVVLGNITVPSAPDAGDVAWPLVTRSATALLVAGGTYLVLDLVLVVNLVHDAYEDAATDGAPPRRRWNDSDTA